MVFSKTFGYALQGVLYVTLHCETKQKIQLDEIAETLIIPRYFLGKIMNRLAKEGILSSLKGHHGGFRTNELTLQTNLLRIAALTGDMDQFNSCVLKSRSCNQLNPCPLHHQVEPLKNDWKQFMANTTIRDLVESKCSNFIQSMIAQS